MTPISHAPIAMAAPAVEKAIMVAANVIKKVDKESGLPLSSNVQS